MEIKWNPDGFGELERQIKARISAVDTDIRARLTGAAPEVVEPVAQQQFADIGLSLRPEDVSAYALAVSKNEGFEFKVG